MIPCGSALVEWWGNRGSIMRGLVDIGVVWQPQI